MAGLDLRGKRVIITGANSGIGYETAKALADRGAQVIMAVRNIEKGNQAIAELKSNIPDISVQMMPLDVADLESIHAFVKIYATQFGSLDI